MNTDRVSTIAIPKGNGKERVIYAPNPEYKRELRGILGELNRKQLRVCDPAVVHGFVPSRSPVTNAMQHIGHEYTVSFDLESFFDSVTADKVEHLNKEQMEACFVAGIARQGLPTSPAVANLAASKLDKAIIRWIEKSGKNIVYTRYADDMTFSFDNPDLIPIIRVKVPEIVKRTGFKINSDKTTCQSAKAGRRIICGVAVDDQGIYPTRATRRRLRAAKHQNHHREARGLEEWCKLTPPKKKKTREDIGDLEALRKHWKLCKVDFDEVISKKTQQETDLGNNCYITNDPAYFMGLSTFTTGWKSCLAQPNGQYRKGVMAWLVLPGTSVACMLSHSTRNICGVEKRVMRARCLVHQMIDGTRYYDRLYGNPDDTPILVKALEDLGIQNIKGARGVEVVGYIPKTITRPYLDSLISKKTNKGYKLYK